MVAGEIFQKADLPVCQKCIGLRLPSCLIAL